MPTFVSRIAFIISILASIAIAVCSSLLYMSHIAAYGISTEVADPDTTIERRSEIAQGLTNAATLQMSLSNAIWWLSLVSAIVIAAVLIWGSRKKPTAPVA